MASQEPPQKPGSSVTDTDISICQNKSYTMWRVKCAFNSQSRVSNKRLGNSLTACEGGPKPVTPLTFSVLRSDTNGASLKPSLVMSLFHRHSSIWPPGSGLQTELANTDRLPPLAIQLKIYSQFPS